MWLSLGDNTIISNIAISYLVGLEYQEPFKVIEISENCDLRNISLFKKIAIVSRFRNSMETKLGQSFQLSEVETKKRTTSVVSRLLDHKGAAIQGPDPRTLLILFNPLPLKEIYSEGFSVGN